MPQSFFKRLALFFLPIVLLLGFPALVLTASGELVPPALILGGKATSPRYRVGFAYSNPVEEYKLLSLLDLKPRVLVLGTSRVMQFRADLTRDPQSFYNAGGIIARAEHLDTVLERIPADRQPQTIIVGLDQYFFNERWREFSGPDWAARLRGSTNPGALKIFVANWRQVYADFFAGKFGLSNLLPGAGALNEFGLNARVNQKGFRSDGSYAMGRAPFGPLNPQAEDYEFRDTLHRIETGSGRFIYGQTLNGKAIAALEAFLDRAKSREIYVVGFLPPFAHSVYAKMQSMGSDYAYLNRVAPALRPLFASRRFAFFDESDVAALGAADTEMIDGFHGTEKVYTRLWLDMVNQDARLKQTSGPLDALRMRLEHAVGDVAVFESENP